MLFSKNLDKFREPIGVAFKMYRLIIVRRIDCSRSLSSQLTSESICSLVCCTVYILFLSNLQEIYLIFSKGKFNKIFDNIGTLFLGVEIY